ncbi:hypothetical protein MKW98_020869 [Papaver atlanticum]|uniref:Uncharacterized protein n=1 Tax=Papaver atlanticum TaxID=357466 RepID=A0AAD4TD18_9MAGN|nr:hypothetical protein MKW98_020869 [Papaver atlanticum]
MSEGGPKLYSNKPKKSQLKKTMSSSPTGGPNPPPPPPPSAAAGGATTAKTASTSGSYSGFPPHKESFARRYKFVWPILLTVNLGIGAYLFARSGQKKRLAAEDDEVAASAPSSATTTAPISEQSVTEPVKPQTPIPAEQQRELYKWILEEKRKVKPTSAEEKKKLDEEKAILKAFIRSKSIPSI